MSGVSKIEVLESVTELKALMKEQKRSLEFAKVQTLYLWKIKAVETVRHLAILNRKRRKNNTSMVKNVSRRRNRKATGRT